MMHNTSAFKAGSGGGTASAAEAKALSRKEKFGFAQMAAQQTMRDTPKGDMKDMKDKVRELTDMLEDRKQANRVLSAENLRMKKIVSELQTQLLGKPSVRGQSAALMGLRQMALEARGQAAQTAAEANSMMREVLDQNDQMRETLGKLMDERDSLAAQLEATQASLDAATADVGALMQMNQDLNDEKEALLGAAEEGHQREGALHADIEALQQTVSELQAQLHKTQLDGAAALRKQAAQAEADAGLKLHALGDESMAALAKLQQAKAAAEARVTALQAAAAAPVPQEFRVVYLGSEDGIIHAQASASLSCAATQDGQPPMSAPATDPEDPAAQANAPPLTDGAGTAAAADFSATPSGSNYLDLVVHDVSLSPGMLGLQPQDLWAIVTARGPGLGTQHLAVIAGDYPSTSKHTLHTIHRIPLATPKAALAVFAANSSASSISSAKDWPHSGGPLDGMLHLSVHNAKASMVGGFVCPCSGAQAGQAVPVAVMGVQHADGSLGMQLLELDLAAGIPVGVLQLLSCEWRGQLPAGMAEPPANVFAVDLQGTFKPMLDSACGCSLFETTYAIPFTGRDGRSYQLWRLAKDDIRKRATFQNLSKQLLEPVPSEAVVRNALSAAQASLPMLIALETPTLRALELRSLREAVSSGKGVPIDPWVCDEAVGVREVACCTSKRQPLATLRLALRLREEVALTPSFLSALASTQLSLLSPTGTEGNGPAEKTPLECASNRAPAGAQQSPVLTRCLGIADGADGMTPSTAPSLPPGHWAAALAAEEMTLSSAVERLQEVVAGACSSLMCAEGVSNGVDIPGNSACLGKHSSLQDALQQGQEAISLLEAQLAQCLVSCAAAAAFAPPAELHLARTHLQAVHINLGQSLYATGCTLRRSAELYRIVISAWTGNAASSHNPLLAQHRTFLDGPAHDSSIAGGIFPWAITSSRGGVIGTHSWEHVHALEALIKRYAQCVHALAPNAVPASSLALLQQALFSAEPLSSLGISAGPAVSLLAGDGSGCPPQAHRSASRRQSNSEGAGMGISSVQISAMSGAVEQLSLTDLAANYSANMQAAIRSASDAIKQQDESARKALALSNADPPALLAQSLACLGAALLPATSCVVQAGAAVADAIATAAVRDPACSARLQEMLQATRMVNTPFHAATSCLASSSGASVQDQMGSPAVRPLPVQAAMEMEGLLQRCTAVLGAFPSSIAPAPHATLPHLQGYTVQSLALIQACSLWALSLAAGGGHALLLAGQRQAAVVLASDLLAKHAARTVEAVKEILDALAHAKASDHAALHTQLPAICEPLTSSLCSTMSLVTWTSMQLLLTPLLVLEPVVQPGRPGLAVVQCTMALHGAQLQRLSLATVAPPCLYSVSPPPPSFFATPPATAGPKMESASQANTMPHLQDTHEQPAEAQARHNTPPSQSPAFAGSPPLPRVPSMTGSVASNTIPSVQAPTGLGAPPMPQSTSQAVPALSARTAAGSRLPEPQLALASRPLLALWLPKGRVLYMDPARLSGTAATTAAATTVSADTVTTAALPLLPSAAALLGWGVVHMEQYMETASSRRASYTGTVPPMAGGSGGLSADPSATLSEAKLASQVAADVDIAVLAGSEAEAGSMPKWLRRAGVVVLPAAELARTAASLLAQGPTSEHDLARALAAALTRDRLLRSIDLTHGSLTRSASATPWPPSAAGSAAATLRRLSLSGAEGMAGAAGAPDSVFPGASMEHAIGSGMVSHNQRVPLAGELRPVAALSYLKDMALVQPLTIHMRTRCRGLLDVLASLQQRFQGTALFRPIVESMVSSVSRTVQAQALLLEGMLAVPVLHLALAQAQPSQYAVQSSMSMVPMPRSTAPSIPGLSPGIPLQPSAREGSTAGAAGGGVSGLGSPVASGRSSTAGSRRALPAMPPMRQLAQGSPQAGASGSMLTASPAPAAVVPTLPLYGPGPKQAAAGTVDASHVKRPEPVDIPTAAAAADDASTASEDEEMGVRPLRVKTQQHSSSSLTHANVGTIGAAHAAGVGHVHGRPLQDASADDMDSDAASLASVSTAGMGLRPRY